jgi:hypothetical protein
MVVETSDGRGAPVRSVFHDRTPGRCVANKCRQMCQGNRMRPQPRQVSDRVGQDRLIGNSSNASTPGRLRAGPLPPPSPRSPARRLPYRLEVVAAEDHDGAVVVGAAVGVVTGDGITDVRLGGVLCWARRASSWSKPNGPCLGLALGQRRRRGRRWCRFSQAELNGARQEIAADA